MNDNQVYNLLYAVKKDKYFAFKQFQNSVQQEGGVTTKSGIYAVLYKKAQLDDYIKNLPEDGTVYNNKIAKKEYVSVDTIRKMFGGHGFFYKTEADVAKSVVNPKKMFGLVKKLLSKDKSTEDVMKAKILKGVMKKNKGVDEAKVKAEIDAVDLTTVVDDPKVSVRDVVTIATPLNISSHLIIEKTGKLSKDIKKLNPTINAELQKIANAIFEAVKIKPDRVDVIKINNVGTNEYIGSIDLDKLSGDETDDFSNADTSSDTTLERIANSVVATDGNSAMAEVLRDDDVASGGFINFDVEYPITGGGGIISKVAVAVGKFFLFLIKIAIMIVVGAIVIAFMAGVGVVCIATLGFACPDSSRKPAHRRGGAITNEKIVYTDVINSKQKYLKYCGKLNMSLNELYGGIVVPTEYYVV